MDNPDYMNAMSRLREQPAGDADEATKQLSSTSCSIFLADEKNASAENSDDEAINLPDVILDDFETDSTQREEDINAEEDSEPSSWTAIVAYISNPFQRSAGQQEPDEDSPGSSEAEGISHLLPDVKLKDSQIDFTQSQEETNATEDSEQSSWIATMAHRSNPFQRSSGQSDGGDSHRLSLVSSPQETDRSVWETTARLDAIRQSPRNDFSELQDAFRNAARILDSEDGRGAHYHVSQ